MINIEMISQEMFHRWKHDPVTQALINFLTESREFLEMGMLDPRVVLNDGGLIQYSRAVGQRDGIDMILELEYEDLLEDNNRGNNDNTEESSSSGT